MTLKHTSRLRTALLVAAPLWIVAALCLGQPALAQDEPAATEQDDDDRGRELYDNGVLLYEEGRYEDAIVAWEEGHRLTERGGFLFNIANAHERLGRYAEALDALGRYRALARADERETLDRRIRSLEQRLAEAPPPPDPVAAPVPAVAEPQPSTAEVERSGSVRTIVGGSMIGVGVGGLGVGTFFGLKSLGAASDAKDQCAAGGLCPLSAQDALDSNQRTALASDISFVAGSLLGAGGVVVLITGNGSAVSVDPGRRLLRINGRF